MTIILTHKDLSCSINDVRGDKVKILANLKQAIQPTVKIAATVWLFDQGRFFPLKGDATNPLILGANQTVLVDTLLGQ